MATAAKITDVLSQALGIAAADARHRARRLRESGHLPQHGHGRGAPQLNSHDCSIYLIGLMVTDTASHVSQAVDSVANYYGNPLVLNDHEIVPACKFVDAIAGLVERGRDLDAVPTFELQANLMVGVSQFAGRSHGFIEIVDKGKTRRVHYLGGSPFPDSSKVGEKIPGLNTRGAYLQREVAVPAAALLVLAELLGKPEKNKSSIKGKGRN